MKAQATTSPNGHEPGPAARAAQQAEAEERRRVMKAAYATLPDALLRHFELLAQQQRDPSVRCGGLELVVAIRRQRDRYARPTA